MQQLLVDQPYRFVPPRFSRGWALFLRLWLARHLRKAYAITSWECQGVERMQASRKAGHGILLASNHCRPSDPILLGLNLPKASGDEFLYIMASWHLFKENAAMGFLLPRAGIFSVLREGVDRESIKCAANLLAEAKHPVVLFPEGIVTRSNDRLHDMMDGVSFIARLGAQQRAAQNPPGQVVVHPVFVRYFHEGKIADTVSPVLDMIEKRFGWQKGDHLPWQERVKRVGQGMMAVKEVEYLGQAQNGPIDERIHRLLKHILPPLEKEWVGGRSDGHAMDRIKRVRTALLPGMIGQTNHAEEKARRWRQVADLYFAQQLVCYPEGYLAGDVPPEHWLETVERFEEDLTGASRPHAPLQAVVTIGEAIPCDPTADRRKDGARMMKALRESMESMRVESLRHRRTNPA